MSHTPSTNGTPAQPSNGVRCSHCRLPVPAGLVDPAQPLQFCCAGCRTVYAVLHRTGLDRFYRLRAEGDAPAQPARTTQRKYHELDDPAFAELYCRRGDDGAATVELYLEGVHCAACVWLVEKLPRVLPGVVECRLDMRRAVAEVRWNPAQATLSQIARTLDSLGYPPRLAKDVRSRQARREENRRFLIRIGVAGACAGNVMTLAFALYGGVFTGIEAPFSNLFRGASMAFGLVALAWPGGVFFRGAYAALRTRTAHLDLPIAIGLAAGGVAGTVNAVLGRGEIYFDSLTMLVLLLLIGRWLQHRQQHWAGDAIEALFSLTPTSARRIEGEQAADVPLEALRAGDVVGVLAGDTLPADGVVIEGRSAVDRAWLTGESQPQWVEPGAAVLAGTVNRTAPLRVRVDAVGHQTRLGQLMRLMEQHSRNRPPIVEAADRIAGRFVGVVLALAAATLAWWLWRDPTQAADNAVALLIVTCPCGLGLATPLAFSIALGRAAQRRILVKGGDVLERLAGRGSILLDKTGTLTAGRAAVVSWEGDATLRPLVAALERNSAHPIAVALSAATSPEPAPQAADVRQTFGGGIEGTVGGRRLAVGSPRFMRDAGVVVPPEIEAAQRRAVQRSATPILVAEQGRCVAVAGVGDPLRDDAAEALAALGALGWRVGILSGDQGDVVAAVASRLGIAPADARGDVSPEEKLADVLKRSRQGAVVMVGDGVNDAAALSAAGVGIAVHGGAEASLAAAHVYLDRPGLAPIVELIRAARATLGAVRRCFAASLCYNAAAGAAAMCGVITPLSAAILMPISSFTVLALAYRAPTFGDSP